MVVPERAVTTMTTVDCTATLVTMGITVVDTGCMVVLGVSVITGLASVRTEGLGVVALLSVTVEAARMLLVALPVTVTVEA